MRRNVHWSQWKTYYWKDHCDHILPSFCTENHHWGQQDFCANIYGRIWPTSGCSEGWQAFSWIVPSSCWSYQPAKIWSTNNSKSHRLSWCRLKPTNSVHAIWMQTWGKTLALHNVLTDYAVPWTLNGLYPSNFSRKQQGVNCCCDR